MRFPYVRDIWNEINDYILNLLPERELEYPYNFRILTQIPRDHWKFIRIGIIAQGKDIRIEDEIPVKEVISMQNSELRKIVMKGVTALFQMLLNFYKVHDSTTDTSDASKITGIELRILLQGSSNVVILTIYSIYTWQ